MIQVDIPSDKVREMRGVSSTSNKPYHMAFQDAWFFLLGADGKPGPYPEKSEIMCPKDETGTPRPFAPGKYILHPSSVIVGKDGLAVKPVLVPVSPARPAA